jgi:hypothetical protein
MGADSKAPWWITQPAPGRMPAVSPFVAAHAGVPPRPGIPAVARAGVIRALPLGRQSVVQPKMMRGQPKIYPNLNASAAVPVDRDEIFKMEQFFDQFRLNRPKSHGRLVANSKYIFVRMVNGDMLVHPTLRHPVLANGSPVLYAGEVHFDNGRLDWWSNGSGNYRPDADHAEQAALPMDHF